MPPAQLKKRHYVMVEWPKEIKDRIIELADETGCSPPYIMRLCFGEAIEAVSQAIRAGVFPDDPLKTGVVKPIGPTTPLPLSTFIQTGEFSQEPETQPMPEPDTPEPHEEMPVPPPPLPKEAPAPPVRRRRRG